MDERSEARSNPHWAIVAEAEHSPNQNVAGNKKSSRRQRVLPSRVAFLAMAAWINTIGMAEGTIIPTIMIAHIKNIATK